MIHRSTLVVLTILLSIITSVFSAPAREINTLQEPLLDQVAMQDQDHGLEDWLSLIARLEQIDFLHRQRLEILQRQVQALQVVQKSISDQELLNNMFDEIINLPDPCDELTCPLGTFPSFTYQDGGGCSCILASPDHLNKFSSSSSFKRDVKSVTAVRLEDATDSHASAASDFIPPPKTDITPEMVNQSLTLQPQSTATVGSVIPYFNDAVISFHVQLQGLVATTLVLNSSTTFPCGNIGGEEQPDLVLSPKTVKNGTLSITVPNCLIIATNMYSPNVINYWVQNENGSVFALVGDNKVHDIDQIETAAGSSLSIRTTSDIDVKRNVNSIDTETGTLERRQVFRTQDCNSDCPFYYMHKIKATDGACGCVWNHVRDETKNVAWYNGPNKRGIVQPDLYTATMTPEACAAMTCINNAGKPAVHNPFSLMCYCLQPTFVNVNPSANN